MIHKKGVRGIAKKDVIAEARFMEQFFPLTYTLSVLSHSHCL